MDSTFYYTLIREKFEANANAEQAVDMSRYMKNKFSFSGIKAPLRKAIIRDIVKNQGYPKALKPLVLLLWNDPNREMQYAAMDILDRCQPKLDETFIPLLADLVLQKSWWDTVDWLAANGLGKLLLKYPENIPAYASKWISSDNMWEQRTAILFQLKYKSATDVKLLFENIIGMTYSNEFFIQKAIGWALREYSKTDADTVVDFIANNELKSLSEREGLKWLKNQGRI